MKYIFTLLITFLINQNHLLAQVDSSTINKNSIKDTNTPIKLDTLPFEKVYLGKSKITFKETIHDFGKVKQNRPVTCIFIFTNTSNEEIAITEVQRSCGCTTPDWNQDPVLKGKTGKISVAYNSSNIGEFSKSISIKFSNGDMEFLTLKGIVESIKSDPSLPLITPDH